MLRKTELSTLEIPKKAQSKDFPLQAIHFGFQKADGVPVVQLDFSIVDYHFLSALFDKDLLGKSLYGGQLNIEGERVKDTYYKLQQLNILNGFELNDQQFQELKEDPLWEKISSLAVGETDKNFVFFSSEQLQTEHWDELERKGYRPCVRHRVNFDELIPFMVEVNKLYPLALKRVDVTSLTAVNEDFQKGVNETTKVKYGDHDGYLKTLKGEVISEWEAANATLSRVLMGPDRAPDIYNVYDLQRKVGNLSLAVPGFKSAQDHFKLLERTEPLTDKELNHLIDAGIADLLVSSYAIQENDVNDTNWGINENGKISAIDKNEAGWEITCQDKYSAADKHVAKTLGIKVDFGNDVVKFVKPEEAFKIAPQDLLDFPDLKTAIPKNWPDGKRTRIDLTRLKDLPKFQRAKWRAFLKLIVLDENFIRQTMQQTIDAQKKPDDYANHFISRFREIKKTLLGLNEFRIYLAQHPEDIKEITQQFEEYNKAVLTTDPNIENCKKITVNIQKVESNYQKIVNVAKNYRASKIDLVDSDVIKPIQPQAKNQRLENKQAILKNDNSFGTKVKNFFKRHWKKILVGAVVTAGIAAVGVVTLGTVPAVAAVVAGMTGLAAAGIAAKGLAVGAIAVGGAMLGASVAAADSYRDDWIEMKKIPTIEEKKPLILDDSDDDLSDHQSVRSSHASLRNSMKENKTDQSKRNSSPSKEETVQLDAEQSELDIPSVPEHVKFMPQSMGIKSESTTEPTSKNDFNL